MPDFGFHSLHLPPLLLRELEQALRTIRYGSVELVIHEGRVVQLERREKVRVEAEVTQKEVERWSRAPGWAWPWPLIPQT